MQRRRGAAAVEFAMVTPIFVLMVFGIVEFGRAMMVQQVLTNATRAGAREAALPESTASEVRNLVAQYLSDSSIAIPPENITVTPDPATAFDNEQITVSVFVPYSDVGWIPGSFLGQRDLRASTRMRSERLE